MAALVNLKRAVIFEGMLLLDAFTRKCIPSILPAVARVQTYKYCFVFPSAYLSTSRRRPPKCDAPLLSACEPSRAAVNLKALSLVIVLGKHVAQRK